MQWHIARFQQMRSCHCVTQHNFHSTAKLPPSHGAHFCVYHFVVQCLALVSNRLCLYASRLEPKLLITLARHFQFFLILSRLLPHIILFSAWDPNTLAYPLPIAPPPPLTHGIFLHQMSTYFHLPTHNGWWLSSVGCRRTICQMCCSLFPLRHNQIPMQPSHSSFIWMHPVILIHV